MPKHVLILHTDQQRADSLACLGMNPTACTPNLDRLAASGTVCTRHIVSNPICSPSRASLLTGLYPPGHGLWCNGIALNRREYAPAINRDYEGGSGDATDGFHPEPPTLPDVFAAAGHDTASFGKLHLTPYLAPDSYGFPESYRVWDTGRLDDWHGPYYGFRYVDMTLGHGEQPCEYGHYHTWLQRAHPEVLAALHAAQPERPLPGIGDLYASTVPHALHHAHWLADRCIAYLTRERPMDRPFCAFVGFPDPHHPFTPSADILAPFLERDTAAPWDADGAALAGTPVERACQQRKPGWPAESICRVRQHTAAMVWQIDQAVGRILDALEAAGLAEDTLVVFTSDHGDFLGDHGRLRKGFAASDALLRVPCIVRAPGAGLPARIDAPVSNVDLLPTLAHLAGVTPPAWHHGCDLRALDADHCAFAYAGNGDPAVVNYTVYDAQYRLTWYPGADFTELYDHADDPGETRNRADDPTLRTVRERLQATLGNAALRHSRPIHGRVSAW